MKRIFMFLVAIIVFSLIVNAEEEEKKQKGKQTKKKKEGFIFTPIKELGATKVKSQSRSGTCWSFATSSFVESELMRMGKGKIDLSEMFVVRHTYPQKAVNYVRLHGKTTFGAGSLARDVTRVWRLFGAMPESVYSGKLAGETKHNHGEMDAVLKGALDGIIANRGRKLTKVWLKAVHAVLDVYLGKVPEKFEFNGKTYTPKSFASSLGLDPNDYIELTSFSHHPFYTSFSIEVPDNWARNISYNLPLNELMSVFDNAIKKGYTIAWDGDVSEKGFSQKLGVAILPKKSWADKNKKERDNLCKAPEPEKKVTQEMRQEMFDNYTSSDDHLMHITGMVKDQKGTRYYITKNSWGTKKSKYKGYIYLSEQYVRAKTISIFVHKNTLSASLAKKLGISLK